jgi:hypothetical protein
MFLTNLSEHNMSADVNKILAEYKKNKTNLRAEQVREMLDPEAIVRELVSISDESKVCILDDLPRLQLQANIHFGILKKCLPDLRSLEIKEKANNQSRLVIDMHNTYTVQASEANDSPPSESA